MMATTVTNQRGEVLAGRENYRSGFPQARTSCELPINCPSGPDRGTEVARVQCSRRGRMNIHKNARLTPIGREHLVMRIESGQTLEAAWVKAEVSTYI